MEFVDKAYKLGAGRYIQGAHALDDAGDEVARVGGIAYVVGGPTALAVAGERLRRSLELAGVGVYVREYEGQTSYAAAHRFADEAHEHGCDVVVGVGGGRIMDLAKAVGHFAGLSTVEVPTSTATCAACSPLSVMYDEDGGVVDCLRYENECAAVVVDLSVLAGQPERLVAAGVLDAMAKHYEICNGRRSLDLDNESIQRVLAYEYARVNYSHLERLGLEACQDLVDNGETDALDKVAFLTLAATGVVSGFTRNYLQTALAHKVCDGVKVFYHDQAAGCLHGELVAIGLIAQIHYNGSDEQAERLQRLMGKMHMAKRLGELGVDLRDKRGDNFREYVRTSGFVGEDEESQRRFSEAMALIA